MTDESVRRRRVPSHVRDLRVGHCCGDGVAAMRAVGDRLEEQVFLAIGAAATCWENVESGGAFDEPRAKAIGYELIQWIRENVA